MKQQLIRYAPPFLRELLKKVFLYQYRWSLSKRSVEEVFEHIYTKQVWGNDHTRSGGGSTQQQTKALQSILPDLFNKYQIKSILDLPCGDFSWMQQVNLKGINYIGGDIVQPLIIENEKKFSRHQRHFQQLNIIKDPLPPADLLLCRDCFVHLSFDQIKQSLSNIYASPIQYLLVTSFTQTTENIDIITGEWRRLNMEKAPFNLKAKEIINEKCPEGNGKFKDKSLVLIDLKEDQATDSPLKPHTHLNH